MFKNITEVDLGDIILDNGGRTTVTKIDRNVCMHKVHINEKDCYEEFASVKVQDR